MESHAKLALQDFPEHFHDIRETFIKRRSKRSGLLHLLHLVRSLHSAFTQSYCPLGLSNRSLFPGSGRSNVDALGLHRLPFGNDNFKHAQVEFCRYRVGVGCIRQTEASVK